MTGATALITVPVMILFGIPTRTALATYMVTLLFMSVGGALPFLRAGQVDRGRLPVLLTLTLIGSGVGAMLVFLAPLSILSLIIPVAMLAMIVFLLLNPRIGLQDVSLPSRSKIWGGYGLTLALGVYGGFFSGGYVTMLMAACVFFFGYSLLRAMVMTRIMNVASSLIASCIFAWHGAIEWPLALTLGCAAFAGGMVGARWAKRAPREMLRWIFIVTVGILAVKSLLFDVPWQTLLHRS